jgi:hypothetical protein
LAQNDRRGYSPERRRASAIGKYARDRLERRMGNEATMRPRSEPVSINPAVIRTRPRKRARPTG